METNKIKKTIEGMLDAMSISYDGVTIEEQDGNPYFEIKSSDSKLLIGSRGETLRALHHLVARAVAEEDERPRFTLDVNGYRLQERQRILERAKMLGERVVNFKMDVHMDPAPPYERLLVHELFAENDSIETESQGSGHDRHLVLKYKGENEAI